MSAVTEVQNYIHFHGAPTKGKILMVASSPATSEQTGWPIGFWAAELTHPLRVFQEAGYEVELVSTEGGKLMMDSYSNPNDASGYSAHDVISLGYMQQKDFNDMLENTKKLTDVNPADYVGIFLVGGQGPMYTFRSLKIKDWQFGTAADFSQTGRNRFSTTENSGLFLRHEF